MGNILERELKVNSVTVSGVAKGKAFSQINMHPLYQSQKRKEMTFSSRFPSQSNICDIRKLQSDGADLPLIVLVDSNVLV